MARTRKPTSTASRRSKSAPGRARSSVRRDLVKEEILATAAEIFADRGFQGTGIREISEAMEMSRPAFYHYFDSKERLLEELVAGITGEITDFLKGVRSASDLKPSDQLSEAVHGLALRVMARPAQMRLLAGNERSLPPAMARTHAAKRHEAFEHMEAIIARGIRAGEFRPTDERIAAFSIFGMCNWLAWWYRPGSGATDGEIATATAELALGGVRRADVRREGAGLEHVISLLREDVAYLERVAARDADGVSPRPAAPSLD